MLCVLHDNKKLNFQQKFVALKKKEKKRSEGLKITFRCDFNIEICAQLVDIHLERPYAPSRSNDEYCIGSNNSNSTQYKHIGTLKCLASVVKN